MPRAFAIARRELVRIVHRVQLLVESRAGRDVVDLLDIDVALPDSITDTGSVREPLLWSLITRSTASSTFLSAFATVKTALLMVTTSKEITHEAPTTFN
jgi:hypothetical protein